jgi:hypothetical protein
MQYTKKKNYHFPFLDYKSLISAIPIQSDKITLDGQGQRFKNSEQHK